MFKIPKIEIFKNFLEKERPLNKGILTKLENNLKTNFIYNFLVFTLKNTF